MYEQSICMRRRALWLRVGLGILYAVGGAPLIAQDGSAQTDPAKAYSTIGITPGETLRINVVNLPGLGSVPPGPCNVQIGFVNSDGITVKSTLAAIAPGQAAFLALTFGEGSSFATGADSRTRLNLRPVLTTFPPDPCRSISSAEVFDALLGRTHVYAVPTEAPPDPATPGGPPIFGIVGLTALDVMRFHVTNISGSNGIPPGPCVVQAGFVNAAGIVVKAVNGTIDAGHTATIGLNYSEAAGALSTNALARLNVRPVVTAPPDPCRVAASAELVDGLTGLTLVYLLPAVQGSIVPPATDAATVAQ